jgi:hypothetical protein
VPSPNTAVPLVRISPPGHIRVRTPTLNGYLRTLR